MMVARATTANRTQSSRPRVSTSTVMELPTSATTASATSTTGRESWAATANSTRSSMRPPKKPPSTPSVVPIRPEVTTAKMPTSIEMRAP